MLDRFALIYVESLQRGIWFSNSNTERHRTWVHHLPICNRSSTSCFVDIGQQIIINKWQVPCCIAERHYLHSNDKYILCAFDGHLHYAVLNAHCPIQCKSNFYSIEWQRCMVDQQFIHHQSIECDAFDWPRHAYYRAGLVCPCPLTNKRTIDSTDKCKIKHQTVSQFHMTSNDFDKCIRPLSTLSSVRQHICSIHSTQPEPFDWCAPVKLQYETEWPWNPKWDWIHIEDDDDLWAKRKLRNKNTKKWPKTNLNLSVCALIAHNFMKKLSIQWDRG